MMLDVEGIKERAEKATGGRWWWEADDKGPIKLVARRCNPWSDVIAPDNRGLAVSSGDMAFIAHARQDVESLLLALSQAETRIEKLRMFTSHLVGCELNCTDAPCTCGLTALLSPSTEGKE